MSNKLRNGVLIIFEGGEAVGKSTLIEQLLEYYTFKGYSAVSFRDPGSTEVAEKIRDTILYNEMDKMTELLLYTAARNDNYIKNIRPALCDGKLVFMDRFTTSTIVYQGYIGGINRSTINEINSIVNNDWYYKKEILLDCPVEVSMERLKARDTHNKYDDKDMGFMQRVRDSYLSIFNWYSPLTNSISIIDSSKPNDKVFHEAVGSIESFMQSVGALKD